MFLDSLNRSLITVLPLPLGVPAGGVDLKSFQEK